MTLGLDTVQHLWSVGQERFYGLVAFVLVTGMTRDDQMRNPVTAPFRTRVHMVDFERPATGSTIGAAMLPFGEQVPTQLDAKEGAMSLCGAFDRGILQ